MVTLSWRTAVWEEISEYVDAGNLLEITIAGDFSTIDVSFGYAAPEIIPNQPNAYRTVLVKAHCVGCSYQDLRRSDIYDPPDASINYEAHLRTHSPLLDQLFSHQLESETGLVLADAQKPVVHLEIVGEVSLNILCESVTFQVASPAA